MLNLICFTTIFLNFQSLKPNDTANNCAAMFRRHLDTSFAFKCLIEIIGFYIGYVAHPVLKPLGIYLIEGAKQPV